MCRECRELLPRHRLQRKSLVSDPGMHHGTRVAHVPLYMSGSLIHGGVENVPGIPGACATRNFTFLKIGLWWGRHQICYSLASGWHANPKFVPVWMINITRWALKKTSNVVRDMVAIYNNATSKLNKYEFREFLLACKAIKAKVCDMNIAIYVICTEVQYTLDRTPLNIAMYLMTTLWPGDALWWTKSLQWRHNDCDDISNHRRPDCLLNRLFRRR